MSGRGSRSGRRVVVSRQGSSSLSDRFAQIKPKTYQASVNARQTAGANNRFAAQMASRTGRTPAHLPRSTRGGRGGRSSIVRAPGGLRTSGSLQSGGFRSGRAPATQRPRGGRAATISAAAGGRRGGGARGGRGGAGGRGRGGRGRGARGGRGGKRENVSKEELDNDLDSYMQSSRDYLNNELDQYQAERGGN